MFSIYSQSKSQEQKPFLWSLAVALPVGWSCRWPTPLFDRMQKMQKAMRTPGRRPASQYQEQSSSVLMDQDWHSASLPRMHLFSFLVESLLLPVKVVRSILRQLTVFISFGEEVVDLSLELEPAVSPLKGKHGMDI